MNFKLPRIYPITDRAVSGLDHTEQIARLLAGGASLIQIRDKSATGAELFDDVAASLEATRARGARLIVNDRVDIALAAGADGVHLGQSDMAPAMARRILGRDAIIGCSTHSVEQAVEAVKMPIDYIAFGPVFNTRTKLDHEPVTGLEMLAKVRQIAGNLPVAAIGGITLENAADVFAAGADCVAIISDLVGSSDIEERMRALKVRCEPE